MQRADISQQTLYRCLNYEVKPEVIEPTKRTLESLALALNVELEDLFRAVGWISDKRSDDVISRYVIARLENVDIQERAETAARLRQSEQSISENEFLDILNDTTALIKQHSIIFTRISAWASLIAGKDEAAVISDISEILNRISDYPITTMMLHEVVTSPVVRDILDVMTEPVNLPTYAHKLYAVTFVEKGREMELARGVFAVWDFLLKHAHKSRE